MQKVGGKEKKRKGGSKGGKERMKSELNRDVEAIEKGRE